MKIKTFIKNAINTILPYRIVKIIKDLRKGRARIPKASFYFLLNKNRVNKIINFLSDQESKETFKKIILWRQEKLPGKKPFHGGEEKQYFINDFFEYGKKEVLIDCGAYIGDTIENFLKLPIKYRQIIAFEPSTENFLKLKNNYGKNPRFMLVHGGVYSKEGMLYFSGLGGHGIVSETPKGVDGEISIKVHSIDGLQLQEKVTFIKMDIEGTEMDALKGAKATLLKDKPRLAICIYHSNKDMLRIAEWIHALVPEYKLFIRHHGSEDYIHPIMGPAETVLYATLDM